MLARHFARPAWETSTMTRLLLLLLHLVIGVSALGAGQSLIVEPDGGGLGFDVAWLDGSPFGDYLVPGLFLFVVIGGLNLAAFVGQLRRLWWAPVASLAAGVILVTWIAIQWAIIGYQSWTQWLWVVSFSAVALLGLRSCFARRDELWRRPR